MNRSFRKRFLSLLILLVCAVLLPGPVSSEEPEILEGYFTGNKIIRPAMMRAGESLGVLPAYEPVTLTVIDRQWGSMTLENGKTGYLFYDGILPMPEYEARPEQEMYSDTAVPVIGLPIDGAPAVGTLEPRTLCVADGVSDGRVHIRVPGSGLTGYVSEGVLKEAVFTLPDDPAPVTVMAAAPAELTAMPLQGAEVTGKTDTEGFFTVYDAGFPDHLAVTDGDTVSYLRRSDVCVCGIDPESGIALFLSSNETAGADPVFAYASAGPEGAVLRIPGQEDTLLPAGERMFVYMKYAGMLSVTAGDLSGYIPEASVEFETAASRKAILEKTDLSGASVVRNDYLDQALAMLEEDNSFLLRYNAVTGADIQALFPLGVPYFWGGRSYSILTARYPEYSTMTAWQSSPLYYRAGTVYLYGYDCVGYVKAVCSLAKHPVAPALKDLFGWEYCNAGTHVFCKADHPIPDDWTEVSAALRPGDILVVFHPGEHVMMYMGTLRDFGYTEEQLPRMAAYLDYPLMLQCGEDPMCYLRFTEYIAASENELIRRATPPDGGVSVCILGVPAEEAEFIIQAPHMDYACFLVEGTCVDLFDFDRVTNYVFYRQTPAAGQQTATE